MLQGGGILFLLEHLPLVYSFTKAGFILLAGGPGSFYLMLNILMIFLESSSRHIGPVYNLPYLVESDCGNILLMSYFSVKEGDYAARYDEALRRGKPIWKWFKIRLNKYRLDIFEEDATARWMELPGSRPLFVDSYGGHAFIGDGNMKGVDATWMYRTRRAGVGLFRLSVLMTIVSCLANALPVAN